MNRNAWNQTADGTAARARRAQTRADVLDMIDAAEDAAADAHGAGAADFDAAASIVRRNLRGAYDARHLLGAGDLLRLALAVRSARRTFADYIDLPEELTR